MPLNTKKSELVLLLLPCLFLAAVAFAFRYRAGAQLNLPDNRFRLTVNRIEFVRRSDAKKSNGVTVTPTYRRARALKSGEEILTLYVFIAGEGNTPKWWLNDKMGRPPMYLTNAVFTNANHRQKRFPCFSNGSGRDTISITPRYDILADCYVPRGVSLEGSTFSATASIVGAGSVRFSAPIVYSKDRWPNVYAPIITPDIKILKTNPAP